MQGVPRILVVSEAIPEPQARTGVHLRLGLFLQALARVGELDLLLFIGPHRGEDAATVQQALQQHWQVTARSVTFVRHGDEPGTSRLVADYLMPALSLGRQAGYARLLGSGQAKALASAVDCADLVFAHRLPAAYAVLKVGCSGKPLLFDMDDVEHVARRRAIALPPHWRMKSLQYLHLPALWRGERAVLRRAARSFVCSDSDRQLLAAMAGREGVVAIPNAVVEAPRVVSPPSGAPAQVLFLGNLAYPPNTAAALRLLRNIWPRVRAALPAARLVVAGPYPEELLSGNGDVPGVEICGFVEDLDSLYVGSRIVCTPITSGGGTRIKLVEAALHGRPAVSTALGAEGLQFQHGRELLLAEDDAAIAAACIELLDDDAACDRLAAAARDTALRHYDRERVLALIEKEARSTLAEDV